MTEEIPFKKTIKKNGILKSINWHLWPECNYNCKFCFARFQHIRPLTLEKGKKLLALLYEHGAEKINLTGGEPFLCPFLGDYVKFAKELGYIVSIVTNGSLITDTFLKKYGSYIDWIGISIDSQYEHVEKQLGRGYGNHVKLVRRAVALIKKYPNIKLKLNTVVTSLNWNEDMTPLILELDPQRWKVFQVLEIKKMNTQTIKNLKISKRQFDLFVELNKRANPITEDNEQMIQSYLMIDPMGRFYDNTDYQYTFSDPILDAGIARAIQQTNFDFKKLVNRGGIYNW